MMLTAMIVMLAMFVYAYVVLVCGGCVAPLYCRNVYLTRGNYPSPPPPPICI